MNLLLIASRTRRWTPWNYFRIVVNFLVGIGFCLVSLIQLDEDEAWAFQSSPMVLPTILIAFFCVLVLNHLPHPPPVLFKKKNAKEEIPAGDGWVSSWDVVGHLGHRSRGLHEKVEPGVTTNQAEGYKARSQSGVV